MENRSDDTLVRKVFSEQIKDCLIEDIINGNYKPGDRLVESALAKRFNVSQAPVREALRGLSEMGFVEIEPYKGTTVSKMISEEIIEVLTVRYVLETYAAGICAMKIKDEEIAELQEIIRDMIKAAEKGDVELRTMENFNFHNKIIQISGHKLIRKLSNQLRFDSWSHTTGHFSTINPLEIADRHNAILDALRKRDSKATEEAVRLHHQSSMNSLLQRFKDKEIAEDSSDAKAKS